MADVLLDLVNGSVVSEGDEDAGSEHIDESTLEYQKLFDDLQAKLLPGYTKMSALNFIIKLMHIKVLNKWTNSLFDQLLEFLKTSHLDENKISDSHYDAKKKLQSIDLGYHSIYVYKYDCALFWKQNKELQRCPICKVSQWVERIGKGKNGPHNILCSFRLKDRLHRLYSSKLTTKDMQWHKSGVSSEEGVMWHPVDGKAWKEFGR